MPHQKGTKSVAQNRKAFHDYFVEERYECGLALFGTEVKSMRQGRVNLKESWARIKDGEIWVIRSSLSCSTPLNAGMPPSGSCSRQRQASYAGRSSPPPGGR